MQAYVPRSMGAVTATFDIYLPREGISELPLPLIPSIEHRLPAKTPTAHGRSRTMRTEVGWNERGERDSRELGMVVNRP